MSWWGQSYGRPAAFFFLWHNRTAFTEGQRGGISAPGACRASFFAYHSPPVPVPPPPPPTPNNLEYILEVSKNLALGLVFRSACIGRTTSGATGEGGAVKCTGCISAAGEGGSKGACGGVDTPALRLGTEPAPVTAREVQ